MINFTPGFQVHTRLGQAAPPPAPAPTPMPPAAAPVAPAAPAPAFMGGFLDTLKWAAIGFGAGALTGFTLAKTGAIGTDKSGVNSGLLGGLGGVAASVLPGLLGMK
jgi:hypothetical protein